MIFFTFPLFSLQWSLSNLLIGSWSTLTKLDDFDYSFEFHFNFEQNIVGSVWSNLNQNSTKYNKYDPDNFLLYDLQIIFDTENEGSLIFNHSHHNTLTFSVPFSFTENSHNEYQSEKDIDIKINDKKIANYYCAINKDGNSGFVALHYDDGSEFRFAFQHDELYSMSFIQKYFPYLIAVSLVFFIFRIVSFVFFNPNPKRQSEGPQQKIKIRVIKPGEEPHPIKNEEEEEEEEEENTKEDRQSHKRKPNPSIHEKAD